MCVAECAVQTTAFCLDLLLEFNSNDEVVPTKQAGVLVHHLALSIKLVSYVMSDSTVKWELVPVIVCTETDHENIVPNQVNYSAG